MDSSLKKSTYVGLNVTVHIVILFSFLSLFFFLYVSKIEQQAFQDEIGNLIEKNVRDMLSQNENQAKSLVDQAMPILEFAKTQYAGPEIATMKQNILVKFMAGFTILLFIAIGISITLTLMIDCKKDVPVKHILLENTFTFILVGIIEFIFFTRIAIKYVPAPPTLMMKTIIETLQNSFDVKTQ